MSESNEGFGGKDMLLILDKKLDKVLDLLNSKADLSEVQKLRERMHKVEGSMSSVVWLIDQSKEMKEGLRDLKRQVEHLESTQVTEGAVRRALNEQRDAQKRTIQWAVGILASLGIVNFVVNLAQGGM